jgi:hypothetical protein
MNMAVKPRGRRCGISDSMLDLLFGSNIEGIYTFQGNNYVIARVTGGIRLYGMHKPKPDSQGRLSYALFGREALRQKYEALIEADIAESGKDATKMKRGRVLRRE